MVRAVDQRDAHRRLAQSTGGANAAEPSAENDDVWLVVRCQAIVHSAFPASGFRNRRRPRLSQRTAEGPQMSADDARGSPPLEGTGLAVDDGTRDDHHRLTTVLARALE